MRINEAFDSIVCYRPIIIVIKTKKVSPSAGYETIFDGRQQPSIACQDVTLQQTRHFSFM